MTCPFADWRVGRRVAAAVLAALVAWPAVAVAQDTGTGAEPEPATGTDADAPPTRVACDDAPAAFELLCVSYGLLKENYIDEPADEDLAAAAAEGVREAGLAPRGTEAAPPCALPSPVFEQTCAEIDAVGDIAAAVWAASSSMFASLGGSQHLPDVAVGVCAESGAPEHGPAVLRYRPEAGPVERHGCLQRAVRDVPAGCGRGIPGQPGRAGRVEARRCPHAHCRSGSVGFGLRTAGPAPIRVGQPRAGHRPAERS